MAEGSVGTSITLRGLEPGQVHEFDLNLQPGVQLSGRLLDQHGVGVEGGIITAFRIQASGTSAVQLPGHGQGDVKVLSGGQNTENSNVMLSTIRDGDFQVRGLPEGDLRLSYLSDGYAAEPLHVSRLLPGESREGLIWQVTKTPAIQGRVVWPDGRPAEGARVEPVGNIKKRPRGEHSEGYNSGGSNWAAITDAQGKFELYGLRVQREVELMATGLLGVRKVSGAKANAKAFSSADAWRARAPRVLVGADDVLLTLSEGDPIVGRVVDETGAPVRSFRLTFIPRSEVLPDYTKMWTSLGSLIVKDYRDSEGRFDLNDLPPGHWRVRVSGKGFITQERIHLETPHEGEWLLRLPHFASIVGHVLDGGGNPVKARIAYEKQRDPDLGGGTVFSGSSSNYGFNPLSVGGPYPLGSWTVVSASSTKGFEIRELLPGSYRVFAFDPIMGPTEVQTIQVGPGDKITGLKLHLPGAGSVVGFVPRDRVQPGLHVELDGRVLREKVVDSDGRFVFDSVPIGKYRASLVLKYESRDFSGFHTTDSEELEVFKGRVTTLQFSGPAAGSVRLEGHLLNGGERVCERAFTLIGEDSFRARVNCMTDSNGRFGATLEGSGTYRVECDGETARAELVIWMIQVGPESTEVQDLHVPTGKLTLRCVSASGEELPPSALDYDLNLTLDGVDREGAFRPFKRDSEKAVFRFLAPGTYRLRSRSDFASGHSFSFLASRDPHGWVVLGAPEFVLRFNGEEKSAEVTLVHGAQLSGEVSHIPAGSAAGVIVSKDEDGIEVLGRVLVKDGRYTLGGVPVGQVWVRCQAQGGGFGQAHSLSLSSGQNASLDLTYPAE
ncbi:MAG: hypothetical protein GY930_08915 [bacterium]|nr:hypothetical protein [bacterium]